MKATISYKTDGSSIPYCAQTEINGTYLCVWSQTSYAEAKEELLKKIHAVLHPKEVPASEMVDV